MQNLVMSKVLTIFEKHYPQLVTEFIKDYCTIADQPGADKEYFYGFGSFKWAMHQMQDIDDSMLRNVFYGILCEFNLGILSEKDIQYRILRSYHLRQYREEMKNEPETADIQMFETFTAGDYTFTLNLTRHNLTSKIFRYTNTDAVVAVNETLKEASITFKIGGKSNRLEGFKQYLIHQLSAIEPGWTIHGTNQNRIVNFGLQANTPSTIHFLKMQEIIKNYFE